MRLARLSTLALTLSALVALGCAPKRLGSQVDPDFTGPPPARFASALAAPQA